MSNEKQQKILEMAKDICRVKLNCNDVCNPISACDALKYAERAVEAGYCKIPDNIGDFSDGYHTFNELYHHRAVLFSVICNMFPEKAWKSKLHDTGDMFEGMFIVGIETEQGQATYHYDIEPYWDMFNVKELEKAPKWDGHTPSDAIGRIGNMSVEGYRKPEWISVDKRLPKQWEMVLVFCDDIVSTDFISSAGRWYEHIDHNSVTHWMPLPQPPKENEND